MNFKRIFKSRSYFDYASTTPLDKRVLKVMMPFLTTHFANASSLYKEGVITQTALRESRKNVATILQCQKDEIIFTSGGTESNNIALLGVQGNNSDVSRHYITSTIEHSSVLEVFHYLEKKGAKVTYLSPNDRGIITAKQVEEALTNETALVSIMYANNEIGTIQPIREIGKLLKARFEMTKEKNKQKILFHVDACQAGLYLPLHVNELGVDLFTLDASKFYGPRGVGMLYVRHGLNIAPSTFGGGQEAGLRAGTENVAGIVGLAYALQIASEERVNETTRLTLERDRIFTTLQKKMPKLLINGDLEHRLPNNVNICLPGLDAEFAVLQLDVKGIAVSSVTSCKTLRDDSSSYVVEEIYKNTEISDCSKSSLRITLGRFTTKKEVELLLKALLTILKK